MEQNKRQEVLTSAFVNIINNMDFSDDKLTKILKTPDDYISALREKNRVVETQEPEGKNVAKFIITMESLYSLVGGKKEEALRWLNAPNPNFEDRPPMDVMQDDKGLQTIFTYLKESNKSR